MSEYSEGLQGGLISPFQQGEQKYGSYRAWWRPSTWYCVFSFLLFASECLNFAAEPQNSITTLQPALCLRELPGILFLLCRHIPACCLDNTVMQNQTFLCLFTSLLKVLHVNSISAFLFGVFFSSSFEIISSHVTSQSLAEEMVRRAQEEE